MAVIGGEVMSHVVLGLDREDRHTSAVHLLTRLRPERANRFAQGDSEKYQEHGAERVCQYENCRQRDQRHPCCEPEGALRDGDGEAA
jgi:hypothetical protein